jgi:glycosyltransferase involved in cell wall biosynthesis
MKVLHLNEYYAVVGGLEQYLLALCDVCEAAGHRTAVVYGTLMGQEPRKPDRPAYHIPGLAGPAPSSSEALEQFAAVLHNEKPDVVVVHQILDPQVVQVAVTHAPTIRFAHGFKMICPGGRRLWNRSQETCMRPVGLACQAWAYLEGCMPRDPRQGFPLIARTRRLAAIHREHSEVIVASHFMQEMVVLNGFSREHVHVVPYFTVFPDRKNLTGEPTPGRLFCAARLIPEKGVDHLLRALAQLPSRVTLTVAGEGPGRPELEHLAGALGLRDRVTFAGWLSRDAIASALGEAEIVVVPSLWPEPFGIVGIEAMAFARPVVAYDVGGVREWLIPDQTGCVVERGDIVGLAQAVRSLVDDPPRSRALGENGRPVAEARFTPERHLNDFLAVARTAASRWSGSTSTR